MNTAHAKLALYALSLLGLLCLVWWAYAPGLHGYFSFDDFANLNALGAQGGVHDWRSFLAYVTSGRADPAGRPITTLTFLIDGNNWPAWAYGFKRTNVLLHLLNGTLLVWFLLKLGRLHFDEQRAALAALVGAAFWMLHPLLVSTTLYVVQREAMLPATFTLVAMLIWLAGRSHFHRSPKLGSLLMFGGLWGGTALAILSKANGALLPLLVCVLEATLLRNVPPTDHTSKNFKRARLWILGIPLAALLVVLVKAVPAAIHGAPSIRPWTVAQRLMTEPRVLMEYLRLLWAPRSLSNGLFNDQVLASTSLLAPWPTLPSIVAVLGLVALGLYLRKRNDIWSFAILFFFAGHLIESSFIALELYFEHRNYLPSMVMFWPLALWLCGAQGIFDWRRRSTVSPATASDNDGAEIANSGSNTKSKNYLWLKLAAVIVIIAGLSAMTHARANLWGDPFRQAVVWARINPDSPRAQTNAAMFYVTQGQISAAAEVLRDAVKRFPDEAQITTLLASTECRQGELSKQTQSTILHSLRTDRHGTRLPFNWIESSLKLAKVGNCRGLDLNFLREAVDAMSENPRTKRFAGNRQDIEYLQALIELAQGDGRAAYQTFNKGLRNLPRPSTALKQAALLGTYGFPSLGLDHLDYYESIKRQPKLSLHMTAIHAWLLQRQSYWQNEFTELRQALSADKTRRSHVTPSSSSEAVSASPIGSISKE